MAIFTNEGKYISKGVFQVVWNGTASGDSNPVGIPRAQSAYVAIIGPTGGDSGFTVQGAPSVTGPWYVLESVTGKSLTTLTAAANYQIKEIPQAVRVLATSVTTAATTILAILTVNMIGG